MKKALIFIISFLFCMTSLFAEGSIDFINYQGHRLFLRADFDQQLKVYANAGEFINLGASHVGFDGGYINVYRPDGTLHVTYNGSNGNEAIIFNNIQESNGPTGGGSMNGLGYQPGIIEVQEGQEGAWSVVMKFPEITGAPYANILNSATWTRENDQPNNKRVILSWDITVSQNNAGNEDGQLLNGRVFTNEYNSMISLNGTTTSPTFYVLTKDGFLYKVDFNEADPFGFPLSANSYGVVDHTGQPTYNSQAQSAYNKTASTPNDWQEGELYLYEPQAEDFGSFINNKIFFNPPNPDLPTETITTDIFRNNTYSTWLYLPPETLSITLGDFEFYSQSMDSEPCVGTIFQFGQGGFITYDANLGGSAKLLLDLNNDGDYEDDVDRIIYKYTEIGGDSIFWDGKNGLGDPIPTQEDYTFKYKLQVRGGEVHILMADIENNLGGVTFEMISDINALETDLFYYDHSNINAGVSGGGTEGFPNPTNIPFTYQNQFGNGKMLDYWTYVVYEGENIGFIEVAISDECTSTEIPDSDGDGLADNVDIDDDNDGIPDYMEYCNGEGFDCLPNGIDPSGDEDNDGIPNYADIDDPEVGNDCGDNNNNSFCDEILALYDTDGDGIPNHLDLDSDNDGIPDLNEAGHTLFDTNGDGQIDGSSSDFGDNGLFNPLGTDNNNLDALANYTLADNDEDGVPNLLDLDSDNDGIHDIAEYGIEFTDEDNDGQIGISPIEVNGNGLAFVIAPDITNTPFDVPKDKDNDGIPDFLDRDSDNDLITDVAETIINEATISGIDSNGNTFENLITNIDPDNDGIPGTSPVSVDAFGRPILDILGQILNPTSFPRDTDNDGVLDFRDLDSDNDLIFDLHEAFATNVSNTGDEDGIGGYGLIVVDNNGLATLDELGNILTHSSLPLDTDNDGIPNNQDLDSDNDGINDVMEAYAFATDPDEDGIGGYGLAEIDDDGIHKVDAEGNILPNPTTPQDSDEDGVYDFLDLDSDNDLIYDVIEAGLPDPDQDGIFGNSPVAVNIFGQPLFDNLGTIETSTSSPLDTDNDGVFDFRDLDSDNDLMYDVHEAFAGLVTNMGDEDGIGGYGLIMVDGNGVATTDEQGNELDLTISPLDSDNDGYPNHIDLDSDNDGINDVMEAYAFATDPDEDGIGGYGLAEIDDDGIHKVDAEGNILPNPTTPQDSDDDGVYDFLDLDSDNDLIYDVIEAGLPDPDQDGIFGNSPVAVNIFGQPLFDNLGTIETSTSSPLDTDNDGVFDFRDLDSDNDLMYDVHEVFAGLVTNMGDEDGIGGYGLIIVDGNGVATTDEQGNELDLTISPLDSDNDGYPNHIDLDSDNDGINDVMEAYAFATDPDEDGIGGYGLAEIDDDGIHKVDAEGNILPNPTTPQDSDEDGVYDFLDLDSDNDLIYDVIEAGLPDPDQDGIFGNSPVAVNIFGQPLFDNLGTIETSTSSPLDTDNDGVFDFRDLDSDNDLMYDVHEAFAGLVTNMGDEDGIGGYGLIMVDGNGVATTDEQGNELDLTISPLDSDNDGYTNHIDLDSDNDGINDVMEAYAFATDPDEDGIGGYGLAEIDDDGIHKVDAEGNILPNPTTPQDSDDDGVYDFLDLDSDNDTVTDCAENGGTDPDNDGIIGNGAPIVNENGQPIDENGNVLSTSILQDADNDGYPNNIDLDSDNDGIHDIIENLNVDPDEDGIGGYGLISIDENGILISSEDGTLILVTSVLADHDNDGIPNIYDLDSDNDGISDVSENGGIDPDNDGFIGEGDILLNELGQFINFLNEIGTTSVVLDQDNDQVPDYLDLDSDNDGINDVIENGGIDPDNDGFIGQGIPTINENGQVISDENGNNLSTSSSPLDTDNDSLPNHLDLDSDNDGINDVSEAGYNDEDNDGIVGLGIPTVNVYGQPVVSTSIPLDTDNDGVPNYLDLDSDNDGINDVIENDGQDLNNNGMLGGENEPTNENGQINGSNSTLQDSDNDNVPDTQDLDSDNDGINDVLENGGEDPDSDGIIGNGTPIVDENGQIIEDSEGTSFTPTSILLDTDEDNIANYLDEDSDNDGISDVIEIGLEDPNNDGIVGSVSPPNINQNGQPIIETTEITFDTDNDGTPDFLDLDSDNDSLSDDEECPDDNPCIDSNENGTPNFQEWDTDNDGIPDGYECGNGVVCTDTDQDGTPDWQDTDSDEDGIPDEDECPNGIPCLDTDLDGTPDYQDTDSDNDGILDENECPNPNNCPDNDDDTIPDYLDTDSDNDGILDEYECSNQNYCPDSDNDTIPDYLDTDSDNDGILDENECQSPNDCVDTDGDGMPDFQDTDSDNDGITDIDECPNGAPCPDTDGDGILNYQDNDNPDTDSDGIPDDLECPDLNDCPDTDGDETPDNEDSDSDNDGILDENECPNGLSCVDTDGDGTPDYQDEDSDNDNIPDSDECPDGIPCPDSDGDNIPDYQDNDADNDGIPTIEECPDPNECTDSDEDGTPDSEDSDSDNDGILDADECSNGFPCTDSDGDGTPDYQDTDSDNDGISDTEECPEGAPCPDIDGDGISDYQDNDNPDEDGDGIPDDMECPDPNNCPDTDDNGTPDYQEEDSDNDGIPDSEECQNGLSCIDTDGDGIPDYQDEDSDNDDIPDSDECPNGIPCPDSDNDGTPDYLDDNNDTDDDGIPNIEECPIPENCPDTDDDGIPDYQDEDSDNDDIPDSDECPNGVPCPDSDNDGTPDYLDDNNDTDDDGIPNIEECPIPENCPDTDDDGIPDYQDEDSDNDDIPDSDECPNGVPCPDSDNDGTPDYLDDNNDTDDDGIPNIEECPIPENCPDTDGDGIPDYQDEDSDNDDIPDSDECPNGIPCPDSDNDGTPDYLDDNNDTDDDGIPNIEECPIPENCPDTDDDGIPDYQDEDSDNDDIPDSDECPNGIPCPDSDNDGTPDYLDDNNDTDDDGIPNIEECPIPENCPDTDDDGIPDYQDEDSDNDDIPDSDECPNGVPCPDSDNDGTPDYLDDNNDTDDDGIPNIEECPIPENCPDTDDDGIPDYQDEDSDNDDIPDSDECPNGIPCPDSDNDGTPDYLDDNNDTDDDGIPNIEECPIPENCPDTDDDGIPDYQDEDSDNDDILDSEECPNGIPCPDSDGDGIPDYLEATCTFSNEAFTIVDISGEGTYCEGENLTLAAFSNADIGEVIYTWTGQNDFLYIDTISYSDTLLLTLETVSTSMEGPYSIFASTANGCETQAMSFYVNIIAQPNTPSIFVDNNTICEGEMIELSCTPTTGETISYQWYFDNGQEVILIEETTIPNLNIPNSQMSNTGIYSVSVLNNNICNSDISNSILTTVLGTETVIEATSSSDEMNPVCEGEEVILSAPYFEGAIYNWFTSDGLSIGVGQNFTLENVSLEDEGEYYVIVSFEICPEIISTNTMVYINPKPIQPIINLAENIICEGMNAQFNISNDLNISPLDIVSFSWINANTFETIANTETQSFILENTNSSQSGSYYVETSINGCTNISAPISLEISISPTDIAQVVTEELYYCEGENPYIHAISPEEAIGTWTSLGDADVFMPNNPISNITNLQDEVNYFVWTLSTEFCEAYSSDTLAVYQIPKADLEDDNFEIDFNGELESADLFLNDNIPNLEDFEFSILEEPLFGNVSYNGDGTIDYFPNENAFGEDFFTYQLCHNECENTCSTALVRILINTLNTNEECFIPNTLTPNNDELNDALVIPCLEDIYTNNHLIVFNRWGDKVFEAAPYKNNWEGTFKGNLLPSGTYFYILELEAGQEFIQGFFTIVQ